MLLRPDTKSPIKLTSPASMLEVLPQMERDRRARANPTDESFERADGSAVASNVVGEDVLSGLEGIAVVGLVEMDSVEKRIGQRVAHEATSAFE
jgi:hypothetical protein